MKVNENILDISENELLIELSKQFRNDKKFQQPGDVTIAKFLEDNKEDNITYDMARSWLDGEVAAGRLLRFEVRLKTKRRGFVYRLPKSP